MPEDQSEWTKLLLDVSRKVTQWSREFIGLPFGGSPVLPFKMDPRHEHGPHSKAYTVNRKWQKGDPVVGFYTSQKSRHRRMVLNLPDGSTLLDMCFPGWEVAILPRDALNVFFSKRYLFGDYHGHLLNGQPLHQMRGTQHRRDALDPHNSSSSSSSVGSAWPRAFGAPREEVKDEIEAALERQREIFKRRQKSLEQAAEEQQKRGVPFDAQPDPSKLAEAHARHEQSATQSKAETGAPSFTSQHSVSRWSAPDNQAGARTEDGGKPGRNLVRVTVTQQQSHDHEQGSRIKTVVRREYDDGGIETVDKTEAGTESLSDNLWHGELTSQLFNNFFDSPAQPASRQDDGEATSDDGKMPGDRNEKDKE